MGCSSGREGDALARAGLYTQSVNPLPFYHHNQLTVIFGGRAPYILGVDHDLFYINPLSLINFLFI
ncbi:hypothetical protein C5B72_17470 [Acinetobacter sp. KU 011TH]|nr:hypothetical protein C5B72_17470 [Acinetobacter sp. KU 011TH]TDM61058.1 hypothetical protein C4608_17480 [Acinetobacter sp. KU 013TH]